LAYVFAGQGTQMLLPWSAYVPAMHAVHVADPAWETLRKRMNERMEERKEESKKEKTKERREEDR
jgi:hypothetical protein